MKTYDVMVETSDWISVDAETEEEAKEKAIEIFRHDMTHSCDATILGGGAGISE